MQKPLGQYNVSLPLDLSLFDGIQTYILQQPYISTEKYGNPDWDMCVLELVTPEPVRGVVFYRLPPIVKKLGTSKKDWKTRKPHCWRKD